MQNSNKKGFTLLELLIVIGIIAILSVVVILVLNPAETLRKSRDTQRMSDLSTMKTALALYTTVINNPVLGSDTFCFNDPNASALNANLDAQIGYSYYQAGAASCVVDVAEGTDVADVGTFDSAGGDSCVYTADAAAASSVDGTGWIPVNLTSITGGSPISNLPLDPTNTIATPATPVSTDLTYRYACQKKSFTSGDPANVFEINAVLESEAFSITDNKMLKDGGDNTGYYEVGTSTKLIGTGSNF